ncbi:MAG: hypothetical protein ACI4TS_03000 [Bacteroidaceae bacterium]
MKNFICLFLLGTVLLSVQSCKRSLDDVVEDFCEESKECLEKRDFKKFQECTRVFDDYCKKLSDEELDKVKDLMVKYADEMKIDSIIAVIAEEEAREMEQMLPDEDELDNTQALPDTLRF